MSNILPTQQEIEEAAKNYSDDRLEHHTTVWAYDGRIDGFKACATWLLAEIQKRTSEGFDEWFKDHQPGDGILNYEETRFGDRQINMDDIERNCREAWQAAKISNAAEMAKKDEEIAELRQHGFHMSAHQCVHPEALTIREGQDGITCAKEEYITTLIESIKQKRGKV